MCTVQYSNTISAHAHMDSSSRQAHCKRVSSHDHACASCCTTRPDKLEKHKRLMGFVPQSDIMYRNLTVEENLTYSACFR